jgi:hypothetical protein
VQLEAQFNVRLTRRTVAESLGLAVVVRYKTHPMDGRWHLASIDVSRSEKNHNR